MKVTIFGVEYIVSDNFKISEIKKIDTEKCLNYKSIDFKFKEPNFICFSVRVGNRKLNVTNLYCTLTTTIDTKKISEQEYYDKWRIYKSPEYKIEMINDYVLVSIIKTKTISKKDALDFLIKNNL